MSTNISLDKNPSHIGWVDILRIVACFLVVMAHCCDPFVGKFGADETEFLSGAFIGSFMRTCVPLFVMISGVLLLPVKMDMGQFYSRRMKRVLIPLVIWSLITPFFYYFYLSNVESVNVGLESVADGHTWSGTLNKLYTFVFNFNYDTVPLWYLYMLVGLYLFMPIISGWVSNAKKKEIQIFLGIWVFTMFLPYIKMIAPEVGYTGNYGSMELLGECPWNPYGTFYYFSGFLGYVVLAYYLVRYPFQWSWGKTLAVALPLFVGGYLITAFGFLEAVASFVDTRVENGVVLVEPNWEKIEVLWYYCGINVLMMTFACFIVFQKISIRPKAWLSKLANLTFGIYLCHFFFVQVSYDWFYGNIALPPALIMLLMGISSFVMALVLSWILSLTGFTKKAIM